MNEVILQEQMKNLISMLQVLVTVTDTLIAVLDNEGVDVENMSMVIMDANTGEAKTIETSPRQIVGWVKSELGLDESAVTLTKGEPQ